MSIDYYENERKNNILAALEEIIEDSDKIPKQIPPFEKF
jgi:hypothetical protein